MILTICRWVIANLAFAVIALAFGLSLPQLAPIDCSPERR